MIISKSIVNLKDNKKTFGYGVEYLDTQTTMVSNGMSYHIYDDKNNILFYNESYENIYCDVNDYVIIREPGNTNYIPLHTYMSQVSLYIPDYCIDRYNHGYKYIIEVSTYINKYKVILCSTIIDRNDMIALDKKVNIIDKTFYIGKTLNILDPWYLNYSDDWEDFRREICGSSYIGANEINNSSSLLTVKVIPVKYEISIDNGTIYTPGKYTSGICSFLLGDNSHNTTLSLSTLPGFEISNGLIFKSLISYNDVYNDFDEYINTTYTLSNDFTANVYISYILSDSDGNFTDPIVHPVADVNDYDILRHNEYDIWGLDSWDKWKEGLFLSTIATIYLVEDGVEAEAPLITLASTEIPITKEIFKYFINTNSNYIDLTDMNITTLRTVNKIEKNIINVSRPEDYSSPVLKPIYIQARNTENVVIHNNTNESIAINLAEYINFVKVFTMQIGDAEFKEIGRYGTNVIFKIIGKTLPVEPTTGTYYILDDNKELVTTGTYTYK